MKKLALFLITAAMTQFAYATTYVQGTYREGFGSFPAVLAIKGLSSGQLRINLTAQDAGCVLTFANSGVGYAYAIGTVYRVPMIETCNAPHGFGGAVKLIHGTDGSWKIVGSNGKNSWTYFRSN